MTDRKTVIRALKCYTKSEKSNSECKGKKCKYMGRLICQPDAIMRDALELLIDTSWISVSDSLPEDGTDVLAVKKLKSGKMDICIARCIRDYPVFDPVTREETGKRPYWVCGGNNNIIFWQPLPKLPVSQG